VAVARHWRQFGRRKARRRESATGRAGPDNRWAVAGGGGEEKMARRRLGGEVAGSVREGSGGGGRSRRRRSTAGTTGRRKKNSRRCLFAGNARAPTSVPQKDEALWNVRRVLSP